MPEVLNVFVVESTFSLQQLSTSPDVTFLAESSDQKTLIPAELVLVTFSNDSTLIANF